MYKDINLSGIKDQFPLSNLFLKFKVMYDCIYKAPEWLAHNIS